MGKKIKIEIRHWVTGSVLFEYECEDNTIKKTVEEAVRNNADLRSADLGSANLRYADLRSADLRYADLRSANLGYADLGSANLRSADLRSADLRSADLRSADLRYADLGYADLGYAKNADWAVAMTRILPEGSIVGWKKCRDGKIVKLLIPMEAKRSHAFGRKCRAEYAEVLEIYKGSRKLKTAVSNYDMDFTYKVGETVKPKEPFYEDFTEECASGIHFYITRLEAENHV